MAESSSNASRAAQGTDSLAAPEAEPSAALTPGQLLHALWASCFEGGGWVDEAPGWDDYDAEGHEKWEADARQIARNVRLALAAKPLLEACKFGAARFRHYADLHASKGTPDGDAKAQANVGCAETLELAIAATRPPTDTPNESTPS